MTTTLLIILFTLKWFEEFEKQSLIEQDRMEWNTRMTSGVKDLKIDTGIKKKLCDN